MMVHAQRVLLFIIIVATLGFFQNCGQSSAPVDFKGSSKQSSLSSGLSGTGNGYDGKVFAHSDPTQICAEGGFVDSALRAEAETQVYLIRSTCQNIKAVLLPQGDYQFLTPDTIVYKSHPYFRLLANVSLASDAAGLSGAAVPVPTQPAPAPMAFPAPAPLSTPAPAASPAPAAVVQPPPTTATQTCVGHLEHGFQDRKSVQIEITSPAPGQFRAKVFLSSTANGWSRTSPTVNLIRFTDHSDKVYSLNGDVNDANGEIYRSASFSLVVMGTQSWFDFDLPMTDSVGSSGRDSSESSSAQVSCSP